MSIFLMCIFYYPVQEVKATRIAVFVDRDLRKQMIVYSNAVVCEGENAMILPIPRKHTDTMCKGIKLYNMETYSNFWEDVLPKESNRGMGIPPQSFGGTKIPIVKVGKYECSIVPKLDDLDKVDFVIPENIKSVLQTHYSDTEKMSWAFLVARFKGDVSEHHPIAYVHDYVDETALFIPTRHIHDGKLSQVANYYHQIVTFNCDINSFPAASKAYQTLDRNLPSPFIGEVKWDKIHGEEDTCPPFPTDVVSYVKLRGSFYNMDLGCHWDQSYNKEEKSTFSWDDIMM